MDQQIWDERRRRIEALPRVRLICGRNWLRGPDVFHIGLMWDKDVDVMEGELCYRRWFTIVFKFRLWIDRSR